MYHFTLMALKASVAGGHAIMQVYNKEDFEVRLKSDNSPLTEADVRSHEAIDVILQASEIPVLSEEGKNIPFAERRNWDKLWIVDPLDGTKEFVKRSDEFTVNIALVKKGRPVLGVVLAPALGMIYWGDKDGAYRSKLPKKWLKRTPMEVVTDMNPEKLPSEKTQEFTVVRSLSHFSPETKAYMDKLDTLIPDINSKSIGSSLKMCLVAEGKADLYPRLGPTMEWDTCAGQAVVEAAGGHLLDWTTRHSMVYNREDLLNPWFMAVGHHLDPKKFWL